MAIKKQNPTSDDVFFFQKMIFSKFGLIWDENYFKKVMRNYGVISVPMGHEGEIYFTYSMVYDSFSISGNHQNLMRDGVGYLFEIDDWYSLYEWYNLECDGHRRSIFKGFYSLTCAYEEGLYKFNYEYLDTHSSSEKLKIVSVSFDKAIYDE